jgi:hypothetical protein
MIISRVNISILDIYLKGIRTEKFSRSHNESGLAQGYEGVQSPRKK